MNSKTMTAILAAAGMALPSASFAAVPQVTGVTMTQATSSRLVTIEYTLADAPAVVTLDVQTNANTSAAADDPGWASIGGVAVCNAEGDVWKQVATGARTITWRPDLSWPDHKIEEGGARAVVTAWSLDNTPDYMVVDIAEAAEPNTQKYYPAVDFLPGGILGNPDYRTTSIVMRKIMAKSVEWTMGSTPFETQRDSGIEATHKVTLTNNYYIAVFEVTQTQWRLIQTSNPTPSYYTDITDRAIHPVEQVCYNEIRNAANSQTANPNYEWPAEPNPNSFLGKLHTKTGILFDLPTEAQWEFAARAGNGSPKWGDGSTVLNTNPDANLELLGCCNGFPSVVVGSFLPNTWGLYDMHGNVDEWCLDWYEANINAHEGQVNIDSATPANNLSGVAGEKRVQRGGSWAAQAKGCRSAARASATPSSRAGYIGFRVVCTAGLQ